MIKAGSGTIRSPIARPVTAPNGIHAGHEPRRTSCPQGFTPNPGHYTTDRAFRLSATLACESFFGQPYADDWRSGGINYDIPDFTNPAARIGPAAWIEGRIP
jgi:hypothetical protein